MKKTYEVWTSRNASPGWQGSEEDEWLEVQHDGPLPAATKVSSSLGLAMGEEVRVRDTAGRERRYVVGKLPRVLIPRGLAKR